MDAYFLIATMVFLYTMWKIRPRDYVYVRIKTGRPNLQKWKIRLAFFVTAMIISLLWFYTIPEFWIIKLYKRYKRNETQAQQGQNKT